MKALGTVVALVAALGFAGCGSLCSRSTDANAKLKEAAKACQGVTIPAEPESECENEIKKCTDADIEKLETAVDCLENVPACVAGQELAWVGELAKCAPTGLSAECEQSVNQ
jgi:hypothetical protein